MPRSAAAPSCRTARASAAWTSCGGRTRSGNRRSAKPVRQARRGRLQLYRAIQPQFGRSAAGGGQRGGGEAVVPHHVHPLRGAHAVAAQGVPGAGGDAAVREGPQVGQCPPACTATSSSISPGWTAARRRSSASTLTTARCSIPTRSWTNRRCRSTTRCSAACLKRLSREAMGRPIDYSQINPRILGNIYEQFLGYVIEIKERRLDPQAGRDTRRKQGSFYTPESVTKFLVEQSVEQALAAAARPQAVGTSLSRSGVRQRAFPGRVRQLRGAALRGDRRQPLLPAMETLRYRALRVRRGQGPHGRRCSPSSACGSTRP